MSPDPSASGGIVLQKRLKKPIQPADKGFAVKKGNERHVTTSFRAGLVDGHLARLRYSSRQVLIPLFTG